MIDDNKMLGSGQVVNVVEKYITEDQGKKYHILWINTNLKCVRYALNIEGHFIIIEFPLAIICLTGCQTINKTVRIEENISAVNGNFEEDLNLSIYHHSQQL